MYKQLISYYLSDFISIFSAEAGDVILFVARKGDGVQVPKQSFPTGLILTYDVLHCKKQETYVPVTVMFLKKSLKSSLIGGEWLLIIT